jgi:hypothetical protein
MNCKMAAEKIDEVNDVTNSHLEDIFSYFKVCSLYNHRRILGGNALGAIKRIIHTENRISFDLYSKGDEGRPE